MSFFKLSKEERGEWRNLPATKAAIQYLRQESIDWTSRALLAARSGEVAAAASSAGAEQALKLAADRLEVD